MALSGKIPLQTDSSRESITITKRRLVIGFVIALALGLAIGLLAHKNAVFPFNEMHTRWQLGKVEVNSNSPEATIQTRTTTLALSGSVDMWIDERGHYHQSSWPQCLTPKLEAEIRFLGGLVNSNDGDNTLVVAAIDCRGLKQGPS